MVFAMSSKDFSSATTKGGDFFLPHPILDHQGFLQPLPEFPPDFSLAFPPFAPPVPEDSALAAMSEKMDQPRSRNRGLAAVRGSDDYDDEARQDEREDEKEKEALASRDGPRCPLERLYVPRCSLGARTARRLSAALLLNPKLRTLNVAGNAIQPEGAIALAAALGGGGEAAEQAADTAYHMLGLDPKRRRRERGRGNTGKVEAAAASRLASSNSSLTDLNLSDCGIGDAGAIAFGKALGGSAGQRVQKRDADAATQTQGPSACPLLSLCLDRNGIGQAGTEALARPLCVRRAGADPGAGESTAAPSALTKLSLRGNFMGTFGAQALAGSARTRADEAQGVAKPTLRGIEMGFGAPPQRPRKMQDGPGTQLVYLAHHEFKD